MRLPQRAASGLALSLIELIPVQGLGGGQNQTLNQRVTPIPDERMGVQGGGLKNIL